MNKGFTLIELLAVVLIMGILSSIAMPQYRRSLNRARIAEAENMLAPMFESRERWAIENGHRSFAASGGAGFTASMLDIGVKNATSMTGKTVTTTNYEYDLSPATVVKAKLLRGSGVKGTIFAYDGNKMYCCGTSCEDVFNFDSTKCF